jgi:hypothetical protein
MMVVNRNMKFAVILSSVIVFGSCANSQQLEEETITNHTFKVCGTITSSSSYCGGAAPSFEEEEYYRRERPYTCWLYVRKGGSNNLNKPIIDSTCTDSQGFFMFHLPPGDYTIITSEQRDPKTIERIINVQSNDLLVDEGCVRQWFNYGLFKVSITDSDIHDLNHNFHSRCFVPYSIPCIHYTGPYPP